MLLSEASCGSFSKPAPALSDCQSWIKQRGATPTDLADSGVSVAAGAGSTHWWLRQMRVSDACESGLTEPRTFLTECANVSHRGAVWRRVQGRPTTALASTGVPVRRIDLRIPRHGGEITALSGFTARQNSYTKDALSAVGTVPVPTPPNTARPPTRPKSPATAPVVVRARPNHFADSLEELAGDMDMIRRTRNQGPDGQPKVVEEGRRTFRQAPPRTRRQRKRVGTSADERVNRRCNELRADEASLKSLEERVVAHQQYRRSLAAAGGTDWTARNRATVTHFGDVRRRGGDASCVRRMATAAPGDKHGVESLALAGFGTAVDGVYAVVPYRDATDADASGGDSDAGSPTASGRRPTVYRQVGPPPQHLVQRVGVGWWALCTEHGAELARSAWLTGAWEDGGSVVVVDTTAKLCQRRALATLERRKEDTLKRIDRKMLGLSKQERVEYQNNKQARAMHWATLAKHSAIVTALRQLLIIGKSQAAMERKAQQLQKRVANHLMPVVRRRRKGNAARGWVTIRRLTYLFGLVVRSRKRRVCTSIIRAGLQNYADSVVFVKAMMKFRKNVVSCQRASLFWLQQRRMRLVLDMLSFDRADSTVKQRMHKEYIIKVRREELRREREANMGARGGARGKGKKSARKDDDKKPCDFMQLVMGRRYQQQQGFALADDSTALFTAAQLDLSQRASTNRPPPLTATGLETVAMDDGPSPYPIPFSVKMELIKEDTAVRESDYAAACQRHTIDLLAWENTKMGLRFAEDARGPTSPRAARKVPDPPPKPHKRRFLSGSALQNALARGIERQRELEEEVKINCARYFPDNVFMYLTLRDQELRRLYEAEVKTCRDFYRDARSAYRSASDVPSVMEVAVGDLLHQDYVMRAVCGNKPAEHADALRRIDAAAVEEARRDSKQSNETPR